MYWKKALNFIKHHSQVSLKLIDFDHRQILNENERSNLNTVEEAFDVVNAFGRFVGVRMSLKENQGKLHDKLIEIFAFLSQLNLSLTVIGPPLKLVQFDDNLVDIFMMSMILIYFNIFFLNP